MIGLLVLVAFVGYGFLAKTLAKELAAPSNSPLLFLLIFLLLLILPWADELVGRIQFAKECKKIEGYNLSEKIKTAQIVRYAYELSKEEDVAAFMPIRKITAYVVDAQNGAIIMKNSTLSTSGGWILRAGLNMGSFTSCNNINTPEILINNGFTPIKDGFFHRSNAKQ